MWICPVCRQQNNGKFCIGCGKAQPRAGAAARPPRVGRKPSAPVSFGAPSAPVAPASAMKKISSEEMKSLKKQVFVYKIVVAVLTVLLMISLAITAFFWAKEAGVGGTKQEQTQPAVEISQTQETSEEPITEID